MRRDELDSEHARFQAYMRSIGLVAAKKALRDEYISDRIQSYWLMWNAAIASQWPAEPEDVACAGLDREYFAASDAARNAAHASAITEAQGNSK